MIPKMKEEIKEDITLPNLFKKKDLILKLLKTKSVTLIATSAPPVNVLLVKTV